MLKYIDYDIVFQEIPDEVTLAINISGCPNRCVGCHTPELQLDEGEGLTIDVLRFLLDKYGDAITCVCFMGGDNNPMEVARLAGYIHEQKLKTGWYSGRDLMPLDITTFDYIKLGAYKSEYGNLRSPNTNQHLYQVMLDGSIEDITYKFWRN